MDSTRFDRFTRSLGTRRSRRQALAAGAAGVAAIPLAHASLAAQDATPEASAVADQTNPAFLFVQLAEAGSWSPNPEEEGSYLLTLTGLGSQTLYFSDRPDRIVGTVSTSQFLEGLGFSPYQPPNAAVVVQTPEGERDVLVVELYNPVYTQHFGEDGMDVLTYQARVLDAYQGQGLEVWVLEADDDQLPQEFSNVSIFIDDCADAVDCYLVRWGGTTYVGPIPGGPYGRCYNWGIPSRCQPCTTTNEKLARLCSDQYEECRNVNPINPTQPGCTVDTCWGAIC
jgi:hypothetical protein